MNDPSKVRIYQNRMEQCLTKKDTLHILTKFNKDHKIGTQLHIYYNQETGLPMVQPKVRGKLKTKYKLKAKEIKIDEIREKVKSILKDVVVLMKYDKKNLKDIINEELQIQKENFIQKLYEKKAFMKWNNARRKTVSSKIGKRTL